MAKDSEDSRLQTCTPDSVVRLLRALALTIGLTALTVIVVLGFAIWVFVPFAVAVIVGALATIAARRKLPPVPAPAGYRKAA